jgi:hypothetical protein
MGNFCATLPAGASGNCPVAIMCPKTLGICQGVTPEMRRFFDQSMQRIGGDWIAQHPGCTRFGQTGCRECDETGFRQNGARWQPHHVKHAFSKLRVQYLHVYPEQRRQNVR